MIGRRLQRLFYISRSFALHTEARSLNDLVVAGDLKAVTEHLNCTEGRGNVNEADELGWTPLMHAAKSGNYAIAEALVSMGRQIDMARCNHAGHSAVDIARFYRRKYVYSLLANCSPVSSSDSASISGSFQRESTDTLSSERLLQMAALPSSVFIVMHNGWPLIVRKPGASVDGSQDVSLMKSHYSAVESFLTEDNLIYLGTANSLWDERPEMLSTTGEQEAKLPETSNQSSAAHFCVDLSKLSTVEVKSLGDNAELIHPFSFLQLSSKDRMLFSRALPILDWHRKNQFCPACGSATSIAHGGYKLTCQNINCLTHKGIHNISYPRLDPSVICAIISTDNDRCLLVRKPMFPANLYSLVAGFIDAGESLEEACVREVYEEVGINITDVRYHSSQFWPKPSVLMAGYMATASSTQQLVVDSKELESAQWFDRSEVVHMLMFEHPEHLILPPAAAIAHRLIKSWVLDSAFT